MGALQSQQEYGSSHSSQVLPLDMLQEMANVVVTFSRCLYAQLEQQQFEPPKGYTLPSPESQTFRAAQLGMKLTCGFEMLYSRREHHAGAGAQEEVQKLPSLNIMTCTSMLWQLCTV